MPEKSVHVDADKIRFPDLEFVQPDGIPRDGQFCKVDSRGNPVGREWDAGGDLSNYGEIDYIPYPQANRDSYEYVLSYRKNWLGLGGRWILVVNVNVQNQCDQAWVEFQSTGYL